MQSIPDRDEAAAGSWSAFHPLVSEDRIVIDQMRALAEPNKGNTTRPRSTARRSQATRTLTSCCMESP
jgi:hypothetical protein